MSAGGALARACPPLCSRRPGGAPRRGSRRPRRSGCWRWWPRCPGSSCCWLARSAGPSPGRCPLVADRPYTLLSCCMSLDGYLAGTTRRRLLLSNDADFDRVDEVRAGCDAILVGAATVRKDNPRLLVRTPARRDARVARGLAPSPAKVTVTGGAELDPAAKFFSDGDVERLVYCASSAVGAARGVLGERATVVDGGQPVDLAWMAHDLFDRGVRRLMVEGGGSVHTQFLTADLA